LIYTVHSHLLSRTRWPDGCATNMSRALRTRTAPSPPELPSVAGRFGLHLVDDVLGALFAGASRVPRASPCPAGGRAEGRGVFPDLVDTASGTRTDRPQLTALFDHLRAGDTLVVWRLDRLGRSLPHLIETIGELDARGVGFKSAQENIDTTTTTTTTRAADLSRVRGTTRLTASGCLDDDRGHDERGAQILLEAEDAAGEAREQRGQGAGGEKGAPSRHRPQ